MVRILDLKGTRNVVVYHLAFEYLYIIYLCVCPSNKNRLKQVQILSRELTERQGQTC